MEVLQFILVMFAFAAAFVFGIILGIYFVWTEEIYDIQDLKKYLDEI